MSEPDPEEMKALNIFLDVCRERSAKDPTYASAGLAFILARRRAVELSAKADHLLDLIAEQDARIAALEAALLRQDEESSRRTPIALLPAPRAAA